jgi:hypothetical protein
MKLLFFLSKGNDFIACILMTDDIDGFLNSGSSIVVCAPSNVDVDQLAEKISATGLKVTLSFFC